MHPVPAGKHELRIDPAHGPGAVARNARQRHSTPWPVEFDDAKRHPDVEVRDLAVYHTLAGVTLEVRP